MGVSEMIALVESVTGGDVRSHSRKLQNVIARVIASNIMRKNMGMSLYAVGRELGIDHSSVAHYKHSFANLWKTDRLFRTQVCRILECMDSGGAISITCIRAFCRYLNNHVEDVNVIHNSVYDTDGNHLAYLEL